MSERFNPRPVFRPGDAGASGRIGGCRALCFNPRPVFRPGDAEPRGKLSQFDFVSIRARFLGRAMPYR